MYRPNGKFKHTIFVFTVARQRVIISKSFTAMTPDYGGHRSKFCKKMIFWGARAETKYPYPDFQPCRRGRGVSKYFSAEVHFWNVLGVSWANFQEKISIGTSGRNLQSCHWSKAHFYESFRISPRNSSNFFSFDIITRCRARVKTKKVCLMVYIFPQCNLWQLLNPDEGKKVVK